MADPVTRSAARLAALIAIPIAVLAGVGTFALFGGAAEPAARPSPTATGPSSQASVPTEPVPMPARELTAWQEVVCRVLLSQLPEQLDELPQRPVTEGPEQNAAYGEPAVALACGVAPAEVPPTDQVYSAGGVCWHAVEHPDRSVWTTLDREVPVQVTVPADYDGPFQRVLAFEPTIEQAVRSADTAPDGC